MAEKNKNHYFLVGLFNERCKQQENKTGKKLNFMQKLGIARGIIKNNSIRYTTIAILLAAGIGGAAAALNSGEKVADEKEPEIEAVIDSKEADENNSKFLRDIKVIPEEIVGVNSEIQKQKTQEKDNLKGYLEFLQNEGVNIQSTNIDDYKIHLTDSVLRVDENGDFYINETPNAYESKDDANSIVDYDGKVVMIENPNAHEIIMGAVKFEQIKNNEAIKELNDAVPVKVKNAQTSQTGTYLKGVSEINSQEFYDKLEKTTGISINELYESTFIEANNRITEKGGTPEPLPKWKLDSTQER